MQIVMVCILFIFAALFAVLFSMATVGGLQVARKSSNGILQYIFYALFFSNALMVMMSTRNFDAVGVFSPEANANFAVVWVVRLSSAFIMLACLDQIVRFFAAKPIISFERAALVFVLAAAWIGNILMPSFFSAHVSDLPINVLYSLIAGVAILLFTRVGAQKFIDVVRNSIVIFVLASLLLIPLDPALVLDTNYTQGYIPGMPRFAGLAPHAIALGGNACIGLWCLYANPIAKPWVNRVAWMICALGLTLAQSKAVWITFIIGIPLMWFYQNDAEKMSLRDVGKMKVLHGAVFAAFFGAVLVGTLYFASGAGGARIERLYTSKEGAQLTSFTGRDKIWEVAMEEWRSSPVFGYGLPVFGTEYRKHFNVSYMTSGHNLYYDCLARAGVVGCSTMALYLFMLLWLGFRYGRLTRGLSAVLALSLLIRSVSEVPIVFGNLGIPETPLYLLLATIAVGFGTNRAAQSFISDSYQKAGLAGSAH